MPVYIYIDPETEETIEVVEPINAKHEYIDSNGKKWDRVFTPPEINTQQKLNEASSEKDFIQATKAKKGTIGDLWDQSRELSEKRKKIHGEDPVRKKYYEDWSKKRNKKVHPKNIKN